jgi:hypothetical protein
MAQPDRLADTELESEEPYVPGNKLLPASVRKLRSDYYVYGTNKNKAAHFAVVIAEISIFLCLVTGFGIGGASFYWSYWTYYHPYNDGSFAKAVERIEQDYSKKLNDGLDRILRVQPPPAPNPSAKFDPAPISTPPVRHVTPEPPAIVQPISKPDPRDDLTAWSNVGFNEETKKQIPIAILKDGTGSVSDRIANGLVGILKYNHFNITTKPSEAALIVQVSADYPSLEPHGAEFIIKQQACYGPIGSETSQPFQDRSRARDTAHRKRRRTMPFKTLLERLALSF